MIENLRARKSVLIVEDIAVTAMALSDALEDAGYEVFGHSGSASDALALMRAALPDLAILDITLRGGSGLEVARELRRSGVPFLVHSGWSPHSPVADELKGVIWLEKPVSFKALVNALGLLEHELQPHSSACEALLP